MKKAVVLLLVLVTVSSCSLFEKPSMTQEEIDAMVNEKAMLQEKIVNLEHELAKTKMVADECAQVLAQQAKDKEEAAAGKYLVIAGSFKENKYAEDYSVKVKDAGGLGKIVPGPSDFKLVVYSTHPSLKEASKGMYTARSGFSPDAWIFMKK